MLYIREQTCNFLKVTLAGSLIEATGPFVMDESSGFAH